MRYCQHCGSEIHEDAVICVHCGRSLEQQKPAQSSTKSNSDTLITIAKVFMIISCVATPAIGLLYGLIFLIPAIATATAELLIIPIIIILCCCIPLAWTLPLTISVHNKSKNHEPVGTGIKVCTLIFVNMIAGILLLCANDEV